MTSHPRRPPGSRFLYLLPEKYDRAVTQCEVQKKINHEVRYTRVVFLEPELAKVGQELVRKVRDGVTETGWRVTAVYGTYRADILEPSIEIGPSSWGKK
jgi:hypothetical protein